MGPTSLKFTQEHFEDVKLREEKAMSEQQQLQQKLKLDRIQWQKQAHLARAQEDNLVANLNAMRTSHAATLHQLRSDNESLQQAFDADYEEYETIPSPLNSICVGVMLSTNASQLASVPSCFTTFSLIHYVSAE